MTRTVSPDPHAVSQGLSGFLNDTWAGAAPRAMTHVNCDHVIIFPDSNTAVTHHTPARPETRVNLRRKSSNLNIFILIEWLNRSMVKRGILIGHPLSGPNFAIRTAKMDRSRTDFIGSLSGPNFAIRTAKMDRSRTDFIGSLSGPNFAIRTAKMDRSRTDFIGSLSGPNFAIRTAKIDRSRTDFIGSLSGPNFAIRTAKMNRSRTDFIMLNKVILILTVNEILKYDHSNESFLY